MDCDGGGCSVTKRKQMPKLMDCAYIPYPHDDDGGSVFVVVWVGRNDMRWSKMSWAMLRWPSGRKRHREEVLPLLPSKLGDDWYIDVLM